MKTKRLSKSVKTIILALILLVLILPLILTLAYFSDKKEYSGTLDFGNIKLKVSGGVEGDGVTTSTSKLVFNTTRKKNNDSTWTGNYMPGDLVEINLTVGLEESSEPAYYMVFISDENEYFETSAYYGIKDSSGNLKIYKSDGQKVVLQSDNTEQTNIYCGKITDSETHNLTISAKIKDELETQGTSTTVSCRVCAIQQANLTEENARIELNSKFGFNLFNASGRTKATSNGYASSTKRNITGDKYYVGFSYNNYWDETQIESGYQIDANALTFTNTASLWGVGFDFFCNAGENYLVKFTAPTNRFAAVTYYKQDGSVAGVNNKRSSGTLLSITGEAKSMILIFYPDGIVGESVFTDIEVIKVY